MKKSTVLILSVLGSSLFIACEKEEKETEEINQAITTKVYTQEIDDTLLKSDLLKIIEIDLNDDREIDLAFEIINLNNFDQNQHLDDSLAARVITPNVELMDNSNYGYPDALEKDVLLTESMSWIKRENSVLGTNPNANFQGKGEKYLGFRLKVANNFYYGWVKLVCSEKRDVLHIVSCGISEESNHSIHTGQQ